MRRNTISAFNIVVSIIFILVCFATVYPFIYAFSFSVSEYMLSAKKAVILLPRGFTLQNYYILASDSKVLKGAFISFARTITGVVLFVLVTGMCAYSMSKSRLRGRKIFFIFFVIPMYINGGMLPMYMLIRSLGLFNNFLVYILPGCFGGFFMFLIKVYLETIPDSLEESARLDGAGDFHIATRIYAPLSLPVIATASLFVGVAQWNSWFDALLYISNKEMYPLQMVLQEILRQTQINNILDTFELTTRQKPKINAESYKMAVLIVTTLPIVFIYPFAQKYFVKGLMIGAVKM